MSKQLRFGTRDARQTRRRERQGLLFCAAFCIGGGGDVRCRTSFEESAILFRSVPFCCALLCFVVLCCLVLSCVSGDRRDRPFRLLFVVMLVGGTLCLWLTQSLLQLWLMPFVVAAVFVGTSIWILSGWCLRACFLACFGFFLAFVACCVHLHLAKAPQTVWSFLPRTISKNCRAVGRTK